MSPIALWSAAEGHASQRDLVASARRPTRDDLGLKRSPGDRVYAKRTNGPTVELDVLRAHLRQRGDAPAPTEAVVAPPQGVFAVSSVSWKSHGAP